MNNDVLIRKSGCTGRITLNRADALNAVTLSMCKSIEAALDEWAQDDDVVLVLIDAVGDKAFSAGGDITDMHQTASAGDFEYGRRYWADEYRLNAKIFDFPKPYVAFMQGYTMGGGVGLSCHGSHRIVCESSQISMPECGIGLVPDVGGSLLLSRAPGRLGEYLGTTGTRMGPAGAILAGFADYFVPHDMWPALIKTLEHTGDLNEIEVAASPIPGGKLQANRAQIDEHFGGETIADIFRSLKFMKDEFTANTITSLRYHSPLSLACTIELIHRVRNSEHIAKALELEYRFVYRAAQDGDFIEGIRAAIIDKDRTPNWKHSTVEDVRPFEVSRMLMPLGPDGLKL